MIFRHLSSLIVRVLLLRVHVLPFGEGEAIESVIGASKCQNAELLPLLETNNSYTGNFSASSVTTVVSIPHFCGYEDLFPTPDRVSLGGVWYAVQGVNKASLRVTVNGPVSGHIFTNCVLDQPYACRTEESFESNSPILWPTQDTKYFLFVASASLEGADTLSYEISVASVPAPPVNDNCENAYLIPSGATNTTAKFATVEEFLDLPCMPGFADPGQTVWFRVEGGGGVMLVSLCGVRAGHIGFAVMRGGCGRLECVNQIFGSSICDPAVGGVSISWQSAVDTFYWIRVDAVVEYASHVLQDPYEFTIQVHSTEQPDNDSCFDAADIALPSIGSTAISVSGTIAGAVAFDPDMEWCIGSRFIERGVWYSFVATSIDDSYAAQITLRSVERSLDFAVYSGSCETLTCTVGQYSSGGALGTGASRFLFIPDAEKTYFVFVTSILPSEFTLHFKTIPVAANSVCEGAIELATDGVERTGETKKDLIFPNYVGFGECCPSLWYVVQGTGNLLVASLCQEGTGFNALLEVRIGRSCLPAWDSTLETQRMPLFYNRCGNDQVSGQGLSHIAWKSKRGESYTIRVYGDPFHSPDRYFGTVGIAVTESFLPENDDCWTPSAIDWGTWVTGSTRNATTDAFCDGGYSDPSVWYYTPGSLSLEELVRISTCHSNTTYNTRLSLFKGTKSPDLLDVDDACCSTRAVAAGSVEIEKCRNGVGETLRWLPSADNDTLPVHNLNILVIGNASTNEDSFSLSYRTLSLPINTECSLATPLERSPGEFGSLGSTEGAPRTESDCGSTSTEAPGVWYKFSGKETILWVEAYTYSPDQIHEAWNFTVSVYTGDESCSQLLCLTSNSDPKLVNMTLEQDRFYHILVQTGGRGSFTIQGTPMYPIEPSGAPSTTDDSNSMPSMYPTDLPQAPSISATLSQTSSASHSSFHSRLLPFLTAFMISSQFQ